MAAHGTSCDLSNPDSPSSTVSIVRVRDDVAEYLTLADSPIVIRAGDHSLVPVTDDRLAHLPGGRPYSRELVRSLRNQPGGFWVASTAPEAAHRAVAGSIPFEPGTEIGIFTDGASRLVESYGYEWEHVFSILGNGGPGTLLELVRATERERPLGNAKQHDDATVVLMTGCSAVQMGHARVQRPANWRNLVGM